MAEDEERSSSEINLITQRDEVCSPSLQDGGEETKESSLQSSDNERECNEDEYLQPKEYKLGKFLSISDTMLPPEERSHEYIAEGPTPPVTEDKPVELAKPVEVKEPEATAESKSVSEIDETPVAQYKLGAFVSQSQSTCSQVATEVHTTVEEIAPPTSTPNTIDTAKSDPATSTPATQHGGAETDGKLTPPVAVEKQDKTSPSNRWFDAYMKCKASQPAKRKLPLSRRAHVTTAPATRPEAKDSATTEQPTTDASEDGKVEKDDFEKVIKITPSKSVKWLEAMQKYRALRSTLEQPADTTDKDPASREDGQGEKKEMKLPQRSSEEPTFSTLAQRAQMFGGIRRKPPLRRAKSFQVGCDNASPLATGLTRPTRVLKKQMTTSFS